MLHPFVIIIIIFIIIIVIVITLYRSPNTVRIVKCRRLKWASHVAEWKKAFKMLTGKPKGRDL